jgi:hypothetical protein
MIWSTAFTKCDECPDDEMTATLTFFVHPILGEGKSRSI